MSVKALSWSFNLRLEDMAAKAVLHALADHADENGRCWPSVARVAQFAGCSEKTARRALQRVADLGIVAREPRLGMSDVFTFNFNWAPPSQIGSGQNGDGQIDHSHPDQTPLPPCPDTPPNLTVDPSQPGSRTVNEPSMNRQEPSRRRARNARRQDDEPRFHLPTDWRPSDDGRNYASDKGLDPESGSHAFVDYFTEGRGRNEKRTAAGWERRWKAWCDRDAAFAGQRGGGKVRPAGGGSEAAAFYRAGLRLERG